MAVRRLVRASCRWSHTAALAPRGAAQWCAFSAPRTVPPAPAGDGFVAPPPPPEPVPLGTPLKAPSLVDQPVRPHPSTFVRREALRNKARLPPRRPPADGDVYCEMCDRDVDKTRWHEHIHSKAHVFEVKKAAILHEGIAAEPPGALPMAPRHIYCGVCEAAIGMGKEDGDFRQWEQHVFGKDHQRKACLKGDLADKHAARVAAAAAQARPVDDAAAAPGELLSRTRRKLNLQDTALTLPQGATRPPSRRGLRVR